jgi:cell division protein FtsX
VALEEYTTVLAAPVSVALRQSAYGALERIARTRRNVINTEALNENPDSAKALETEARPAKVGQWEAALKDVSASQTIDFDEGTVEDLNAMESTSRWKRK